MDSSSCSSSSFVLDAPVFSNGPDDYIDLAVGARLKTDGSLKFEPMVTPSAVVPDAASALALSGGYDTLSAAKQVCDEVVALTKMEFINPLKSIK